METTLLRASAWLGGALDGWPLLSTLFAAAACARLHPVTSGRFAGFLLPAFLLLFRKAALYIPVPGTVSSEDAVTFWSTGALLYFGLFLAAYGFLHTAVRSDEIRREFAGGWSQATEDEGHWRASAWQLFLPFLGMGYAGCVFASIVLLPIDGAGSHFASPLLAPIAVWKLLLVNPLVLPAAATCLALQCWFSVYRFGGGARAVNAVLLLAVIGSSLVNFGTQAVKGTAAVQQRSGLIESWPNSSPEVAEARNLVQTWIARVPQIAACGVNVVEGGDALYSGCGARALIAAPQAAMPVLRSTVVLSAAGILGFVVLAATWPRRLPASPHLGSESRLWSTDTVVSARIPVVAPIRRRMIPTRWWVVSVMPVALLVAGFYIGNAPLVIAGLALSLPLRAALEQDLIVAARLEAVQQALLLSLSRRDAKGRRVPGLLTWWALDRATDSRDVLSIASTPLLLATVASGRKTVAGEILGAPNTAALAGDGGCTPLTQVAFALGEDASSRALALRQLPKDLWAGAAAALCHSEHPEAREAGVQLGSVSRRTLLHHARRDDAPSVRQAAIARLRGTIDPREAGMFCKSKFSEARVEAIRTGLLPRTQIARMYRTDPDVAVVRAAWHVLATADSLEVEAALDGGDLDMRVWSVEKGAIARARLVEICRDDWQAAVRGAAWIRLRDGLTQEEGALLATSSFEEVRAHAAGSSQTPRSIVLGLCIRDSAPSVRAAAWSLLHSALTPDEAAALANSNYDTPRLRDARSVALTAQARENADVVRGGQKP